MNKEIIKKILKEKNITQKKLCNDLNIKDSTFSNYINNKRKINLNQHI